MNKSYFKLNRDIYIINAYVTPYTDTPTKKFDGREMIQDISNLVNELLRTGDIILCGDFNARISQEPGTIETESSKSIEYISLPVDYVPDQFKPRCSQDTHKNNYCNTFLSLIRDNSLSILNGRTLGDLSGKLNTCGWLRYCYMIG